MNDDKNETHMMTDGVVYMGDAVKATRTADGVIFRERYRLRH